VLKNFYRDTLLQLDGSQRRKAAELCEEGLLDASGHRLMLEEGQIRNDFRITLQSLAILSYERLLRRERRLESAFYEISHDRLAESILRAKRFRLPKRVKRALWTAAIMAPIVLAGLLLWVASLGVAKRKIDNLNGFLLGNFLEEVRDIGRSTMLGEVQEKIKDVGDVDQMSGLNRGLALRNRGDLERTYGSVAAASTLYADAIKAFEKSPDEAHQQRALARTHERLGDAFADQGKVTEALTSYEGAIKAWRRVVSNSAPVENKDCTSLADSLVSAGELHGRLGETTRALDELEEATAISSSILFPYHRSPNGCGAVPDIAAPYPDAKALGVTGHAALLRATILNFPEDYEGTAALAMEARRLNPTSISTREQALTALAWRGNGRLSTPQRAIADYQTALRGFEALRRWDPTNRSWQRQRAANLLILGDGIVACQTSKTSVCTPAPPLEEAEAIDLEAVATLRALSSKDPENVSWQEDLGWALQEEARVLAASNRHAERLAMVEKAEPLFRGCQRESADTECPEKLGELLMDKSDAMVALERVAEARQSIEASDEVFKRLIAAHPDNPTFVYDLSEARKKEAEILRKAGDAVSADAAAAENERLLEKYWALTGVRGKPADELNSALLAHNLEGNKLYEQKRFAAALREYDAAESAGRKYVSLRPANSKGYDNLRVVYQSINYSQEKLGNAKERAIALNAAMQVAQIAALLAREDAQTTANARLLEARHQFGAFLYDNNRLDDALAMVQEEIAVADSLVDENKQNAFYLWRLGNAQCGLGMLRRKHQNGPGWEEAIRSGLIQEQKAVEIDSGNADYLNEVAHWREYLAGELKGDGRKEEALAEYQLALKTYQETVKRFPGNETAEKGIQELAGQGIQ
jgi:tetratricopeptide (TPR) repeat protein